MVREAGPISIFPSSPLDQEIREAFYDINESRSGTSDGSLYERTKDVPLFEAYWPPRKRGEIYFALKLWKKGLDENIQLLPRVCYEKD